MNQHQICDIDERKFDEPICFRPDKGTEKQLNGLGLVGKRRARWLRQVINRAIQKEKRKTSS